MSDLCCTFADKCTEFCTTACKLFNSTVGYEMAPRYTDYLQVTAAISNNTTYHTQLLSNIQASQ